MIKHVGKHNNRKVVILYRKVPGEDHMCLICYPDVMPRHIHDGLMAALESDSGQQAKEFSDYLFRLPLADGNNALQTLHKEGMIKKVPTNQVIVTPDMKSTVRLDELNTILDKMALGEEAIKELADLDKNSGLTGKRNNVAVNEVRAPRNSRSQPVEAVNTISIHDVLTDEQLAVQRQAQAAKMIADAKQLLAEAERLQKEAQDLSGTTTEQNGTTTKSKKAKTQKAES